MNIYKYIIQACLNNRFFVIILAMLIASYGLYCSKNTPVDILPELDKTIVTIVTEAKGLAPEEIENQIVIPLEIALSGMNDLNKIRSTSSPSLSLITLEFDWDSDVFEIRQMIQERLSIAKDSLPLGINPIIAPISSAMGEIMIIGLSNYNMEISKMKLREIAEYDIARRIAKIGGVSQVLCTGGELRELRIIPDTQKMALYKVSLDELKEAVANSQTNTGGGLAFNSNIEFSIRNTSRTLSLEDISNSIIKKSDNRNILLKDVALVQYEKSQMRGDASVNGIDSVILSVSKQAKSDTLKISKEIEAELAQIEKSLPKYVELDILYRHDSFIESSIKNVEDAIIDGAIMVVLILFLFLLNYKTTLITIIAIPMSLAISFIYFKLSGATINTMTLGGLAVAIGMLVDDAIVDVENVNRRLMENVNKAPLLKVILDASIEVRASIFYATLLILVVFLPSLGLVGIEGKMFRPLSEAVIVSMIASFLVALTLIPVLCSLLLRRKNSLKKEKDAMFSSLIKKIVEVFLIKPAVKYPKTTLFLGGVFVALSLSLYPIMGRDFIPSLNEANSLLMMQVSADSSIERSRQIADIVDSKLLKIPEINTITRKIGRAEKDDHAEGVNNIESWISFKGDAKNREKGIAKIREALDSVAGVSYSIGKPLAHRIDYMLSGVQSNIAVKIFGDDIEFLQAKAIELKAYIDALDDSLDVNIEQQRLIPQLKISVDREKAKLYSMQVGKVNSILQDLLGGVVVADIIDGEKSFDVLLRLDDETIANKDKIANLLIANEEGQYHKLSSFADIQMLKGPNQISRDDLKRRIAVSVNTSSSNSVELANNIREIIDEKLALPSSSYASIEGQFQSSIDASRRISILFAFSILIIFALLYVHFGNVNYVLQILLAIPVAFGGGLIFSYIKLDTLSVASMIGMIALAGIAARNSIMMISHYVHLMKNEGEVFGSKMIIRATLERVNPILMTALTASFALLPLLSQANGEGKELLYPVSIMIIGGLISSTLLSFLITPASFMLFGKNEKE